MSAARSGKGTILQVRTANVSWTSSAIRYMIFGLSRPKWSKSSNQIPKSGFCWHMKDYFFIRTLYMKDDWRLVAFHARNFSRSSLMPKCHFTSFFLVWWGNGRNENWFSYTQYISKMERDMRGWMKAGVVLVKIIRSDLINNVSKISDFQIEYKNIPKHKYERFDP